MEKASIKIRFSCYNEGMPFLPDLLTKIKNWGAAGKERFRGRKGFIFIGLGLLLGLCFLIAVLLVMNHTADTGPRTAGDGNGLPQRSPIPPEELFLPAEPDFLPGVTLERERRQSWTAEDAEPYWQDPLKSGEEPWRDRVEAVVDELLERAP
jgi:hypothetical protein